MILAFLCHASLLGTHPARPLLRMVEMLMRMSCHSALVSPVQCAAYEPDPRNVDLRVAAGGGRAWLGTGLGCGSGSGLGWGSG